VAEAVSERADPRSRPPDPAGTRPKFDPDALRPTGDFRALPAGGPAAQGGEERLPDDGSKRVPEDGTERLPEPPVAASPPDISRARPQAPHAPRFQFLLGAFGALSIAAIAVAVSLALAPKSGPGVPWSSWKPSGDIDPAVQIAQHVAPEYTGSAGRLLVNVTGGPQQIAGQPVVVALRSSGSEPVPLENNGVFYQLCGTGPNCSIPGKASNQRGLLVRREALELALYTLHYVSSTSQVIVTYPPRPPVKGSKSSPEEALSSGSSQPRGRALLFRPDDLAPELSQPLSATLASQTPTLSTIERAPEARLVDQITGRLLYNFELTTQQSTPVLLLQAPTLGS
jgi:hypothetical protein